MIIARSPLRLSLGGGGTDLPSYYREHEGFLIAAAIDKYVYITIHQTFITDLIIKYSSMERVASIEDVKHPILREALKLVGIQETNLEITSMADTDWNRSWIVGKFHHSRAQGSPHASQEHYSAR
jgi:D-glycero-alpha-D-manno-heptose-7-phosphate kinase